MKVKVFKNFLKFFAYALMTLLLVYTSFEIRNFLLNYFANENFTIFTIDFVRNSGAAFSILQTHTNLLILISIPVLFFVIFYVATNIKRLSYGTLMLLSFFSAGILGNLLERIFDGYVTDYISLNFMHFPIFNLSDVFINVSAFLIICNILFGNDGKKA